MATPKLTTIIGGVSDDVPPVNTGLIGWFSAQSTRDRMAYPLGYLSEAQDTALIADWPAMLIHTAQTVRQDGPQAKAASLELTVYLKDPRAEVADREMRQMLLDIEQEINRARRGQRFGATDFRWERNVLSGIGTIRGTDIGVSRAVMHYTVLYVENYA